MKVVGRGRTEEMRNKEIIIINLTWSINWPRNFKKD